MASAFTVYDGNDGVAATGVFSDSKWSWCGQQSDNPAATVQEYLSALDTFEAEHPGMRYILMTGHSDGTSGPGSVLERNNDLVSASATLSGGSVSPIVAA